MKLYHLALTSLVLVAGCQTSSETVPLITARAAQRAGESAEMLRQGRALFVRRCIECHAVPVIARHSAEAWPRIVSAMAARADLKPSEEEAITAYIVTLRKIHD